MAGRAQGIARRGEGGGPGHLSHLHARSTTFALISRAPQELLERFRARMGWTVPWYSSAGNSWNYDFHATSDESVAPVLYNYRDAEALRAAGRPWHISGDWHGLSVFLRDGDRVLHTYSTFARGLDILLKRRLLDRYARAFTEADVGELLEILTEDAAWEMPPMRTWFTGRETIVRFIAARLGAPGGYRMIPTVANGQPAFAAYLKDRSGTFRAHALHVLTLTGAGVSRIVAFMDPAVFTAFGLPVTRD